MAAWVPVVAGLYIAIYIFLVWAFNQHSWVWQRCGKGRRAPLLIVPLASHVPKSALPKSFWAMELIEPRGSSTSHCFPRCILLLWRLLVLPFYIGSFIVMESNNNLGGLYMTYYTLWTFTLFFFTFMLGAFVVFMDMRAFPVCRRDLPAGNPAPAVHPAAQWDILRTTHQLCFECVAPASLFVAVFYWVALFSTQTDPALGDQLFIHALNNIWMLGDAVLSRVSFASSHLLLLLLYSVVYLIFMWIYGGITGDWPYSTLTFEPWTFPYYIALPFALTIAYFVYVGVVALREWTAVHRCRCSSSDLAVDAPRSDHDARTPDAPSRETL